MESKQVEARITHEDGYCSLVCQIVWRPELSDEGRASAIEALSKEFDRIMKGKK